MADTKISAFDALATSSSADLLAIVQATSTITKKITVTKLVDDRVTPLLPVKASGAEINTGTNDTKFATPKAITDSNLAFISNIPVKATGAEINTGTNDTKFATPKAIADSSLVTALDIYPIGAIYISIVSTNPSSLFGGTWVTFGAGKMLISLDSGDVDFDTAEEIGGAKTHALTTAELAAHTHNTLYNARGASGVNDSGQLMADDTTADSKATSAAGSGNAHENMPPFIAVYMFKRTA